MSHFLVLGAGKMGVVLAKDLIEVNSRNNVTLVDISSKHLKRAADFIQSKRVISVQTYIEDERQRYKIFKGYKGYDEGAKKKGITLISGG